VSTAPKKQLTLFDSTCLIMGIIIGAGIFRSAGDIPGLMPNWWSVLILWAIGGVISLFGALAYAELATAYPHQGGDYVYLGRAYGRWSGFLFGWVQLSVVRPGDIAVMAFAFATYARTLFDPFFPTASLLADAGHVTATWVQFGGLPCVCGPGAILQPIVASPAMGEMSAWQGSPYCEIVYACAATLVFTAINILGVTQGKWTQNLLTLAKVLGLGGIVLVAVLASPAASTESAAPAREFSLPSASLALIFVLFTFGGWNEMAYVAAEVKNPHRNIWRALILGTVTVTVVYLLVNSAYLRVLGFDGMAKSDAVATATVSAVFPKYATVLISVLVCVSALGAVNGLVFTGARISYAVGSENRAFRWLGQWNSRTGTPVPALLVQGIITLILVVTLGSFEKGVIYTASAVYTFYLFTSLAVIVLRDKEPQVDRPFRLRAYPLYPLTTFIFGGVCVFLIYSAVVYKPVIAAIALGIALAGLPIYWITMPWRVKGVAADAQTTAE